MVADHVIDASIKPFEDLREGVDLRVAAVFPQIAEHETEINRLAMHFHLADGFFQPGAASLIEIMRIVDDQKGKGFAGFAIARRERSGPNARCQQSEGSRPQQLPTIQAHDLSRCPTNRGFGFACL